jgi:hypothetical protein
MDLATCSFIHLTPMPYNLDKLRVTLNEINSFLFTFPLHFDNQKTVIRKPAVPPSSGAEENS